MADFIFKQEILQEFLPVINSDLTKTLDMVLSANGMQAATTEIIKKGIRELNAPSTATSAEDVGIAYDKSNTTKSVRSSVTNICQVNAKFVSLTNTQTALESGRLTYEVQDRILELKQDINLCLWTGVYNDATVSGNRAMGSIVKDVPVGNVVSKAKASTTVADFTALIIKLKKAGTPTHIFGGYQMIKDITTKLKATEQRTQNDSRIALDVDSISVAGVTLMVVIDESVPADTCYIGTTRFLEFYFVNPLRTEQLAKTGLTTDYAVSMESCVINRNPLNWGEIHFTDND